MINLFRWLLKEPDEDPALVEQMLKITQQFDRINLEVQDALKSELVEEQKVVIDKALEELPRLEREFRALPSTSDELRHRYLDYFPEVVATYILFCQHYEAGLAEKTVAISYLKEAMRLIKEAQRNFKL